MSKSSHPQKNTTTNPSKDVPPEPIAGPSPFPGPKFIRQTEIHQNVNNLYGFLQEQRFSPSSAPPPLRSCFQKSLLPVPAASPARKTPKQSSNNFPSSQSLQLPRKSDIRSFQGFTITTLVTLHYALYKDPFTWIIPAKTNTALENHHV